MDPLNAEDPVAIGPFRLLGRLGVGGMGRVYLARSAGGRAVAVKVVHPELAAQDEFRRRFAREVAALERVGGSGTAPVLGADTGAELPWVAVGYVPGPSLRAVVGDDHGPLPSASVRTLASGLARALTSIHAAGLVHRDLKPSNVLLTVDGPQIIDFGIARALDTVTDGGLTSTGAVVGSPGFMSPEQVRGEKVTPASDIFCLGSVLVYAATGHSPFGGSDSGVHATMFRIANDEPELTGLAPELTGLIRACLAKDPAARPSATELVETLQVTDPWLPAEVLARLGRHAARVLEAESASGIEAGDPTPATPLPPTAGSGPGSGSGPRSRRRGLAAAVGALVVVAAAGLAYVYGPLGGLGAGGDDGGQNGKGRGGSGTTGARPSGIVPAAFIGAWEGVLKGRADIPYETSRIEITQGAEGARTAVYTHVTGERLCMGRAAVLSATESELVLGEAEITASVPAQRCTPAARQTLRLRSTDVVEWSSGVAKTTFQRVPAGPAVVPATLVGGWTQSEDQITQPEADRYTYHLTITQGPVGAPLVRYEQSFPRTDKEGNTTSEDVRCVATAVVGGAGNLLVVGPEIRDPETWDPECAENGSGNFRIVRYQGKELLHLYGMTSDGEPAEFVRD
ncbi:serine/threonine-protein kinase [Streptomyces roseicoloratus]|uniref:Serine/threonine-protein kinase n=1 Tax=Streptomyces roseicoloratus TaxID=2508722 RepID=A0ABY9RZJ5_9ACTN|nr:serine/threonine-protein kinase [Streptomyces roseicoloratus]WMX46290.1 serine/threonine-protein kinase [Streptomyces roseicoloratus]